VPHEPASPELARAIAAVRGDAGLTQETVAIEAGVTPGYLSKIERAVSNPSWTTVERIADALDISLVELAEAVEAERA
jgi:transcriptional regulator with XRE-family HTH domain